MNTIIEKIRAEVERLKEEHQVPTFPGDEYEEGGINGYQIALDKVLAKLDTLQEQPVELENKTIMEEIRKLGCYPSEFDVARRFYELGRQSKETGFPTTDEEMEEFLATHPKVEFPEKYKTPDWMFEKSEKPTTAEGLEEEIDKRWKEWLSDDKEQVEGVLPKSEFAFYARHFYELGRQSLKDKDTFDEVDDAILELVIRAVQERKGEDTGYEKHYDRLLNWLGELPNWVRCKPKVCEGLEDILLEFYDEYDSNVENRPIVPRIYAEKLARHFAQWQREQMISALKNDGDLPIEFIDKFHEIDRNAFQNGQENMKAKLMKEAVEGRVISNDGISFPVSNEIHRLKLIEGDKFRIIIVKGD